MGVYPLVGRESRSGVYITGGGYYNGILSLKEPNGFGLSGGIGFQKNYRSLCLLSSELLIRCGYYSFRNGDEVIFDSNQKPPLVYIDPDFQYHMLLSQGGVSSKVHIPLGAEVSVFLGGEISFILINGKSRYGDIKRSMADNTWGYGFCIGGEKVIGGNTLGCSIGYTEFSYRDILIKNKPTTFLGEIKTLNSWIQLSIFLKRFF